MRSSLSNDGTQYSPEESLARALLDLATGTIMQLKKQGVNPSEIDVAQELSHVHKKTEAMVKRGKK